MHLSNSLLKYVLKITSKMFVRSGIWTHARIRGPEHSQLAAMQARYYPWVWRLRPLGHPDIWNNDALWKTFDWTTLGPLRYHSFYALPTQSLTYIFRIHIITPTNMCRFSHIFGGTPTFCYHAAECNHKYVLLNICRNSIFTDKFV